MSELQTIGKPFAVVVNSAQPDSPEAQRLRASLEDRYGVDCICTDCMQLEEDGIAGILKCVLDAFPLREIGVRLPTWVDALPNTHELKRMLYAGLLVFAGGEYGGEVEGLGFKGDGVGGHRAALQVVDVVVDAGGEG